MGNVKLYGSVTIVNDLVDSLIDKMEANLPELEVLVRKASSEEDIVAVASQMPALAKYGSENGLYTTIIISFIVDEEDADTFLDTFIYTMNPTAFI